MTQNNIRLDQRDYKILSILHKDSRTPLAVIGKQIKLSKDAVLYRITKMQNQGIIVKFYLDFNYKLLGFTKYITFLQLKRLTEHEKELVKTIVQQTGSIIFCAQCTEKWDYWLEILADSLSSFNTIMNTLANDLKEVLEDYEVFIEAYCYKEYEPLVEEHTIKTMNKNIKQQNIVKINNHEYAILKALENNSKISFIEIAKKTKLSLDIIKYRFKRLKELGVINRCDVVIDYNKIGYELHLLVFSFKSYSSQEKEKFIAHLMAHPNIRSISSTIGGKKLFVESLTRNNQEYLDMVNTMRMHYCSLVAYYEEMMIAEDIKDSTVPQL